MSNGLSAQMIRKLTDGRKKSNQEIIIEHLISEDGAVRLTPLQENLLKRWKMADDLMRSRRYKTNEIVRILRRLYNYGIASAQRDIEDARFVFGSSRKNSKHYHLSNHVEYIDDYIIEMREKGEHELAIKLISEKTKALKEIQEDKRETPPPSAIIFNITTNHFSALAGNDFTEADAEEVAQHKLKEAGITLDLSDNQYEVSNA